MLKVKRMTWRYTIDIKVLSIELSLNQLTWSFESEPVL